MPYVVLFRKRPAYRYTVKHSIYVHRDYIGHGVGRLLMQELIDSCAAAGFRQMIGYIDADNTASLAIHDKFGFHRVGLLPGVAYRYGRWADTVMVQRSLAAGSTEPPQPASFSRCAREVRIGARNRPSHEGEINPRWGGPCGRPAATNSARATWARGRPQGVPLSNQRRRTPSQEGVA